MPTRNPGKLEHDILFDLQSDPGQQKPFRDAETEERMERALIGLLKDNDAPKYLYKRFGLDCMSGKREEVARETDL